MKVYIAADFNRAAAAEEVVSLCRSSGLDVVSTWHTDADPAEVAAASTMGGPSPEVARAAAQRNLAEMRRADVVIELTTGEPGRGGRHFETGYAHAMGKPVVLVGPFEHAFHHLDGVRHADDASVLIEVLT